MPFGNNAEGVLRDINGKLDIVLRYGGVYEVVVVRSEEQTS